MLLMVSLFHAIGLTISNHDNCCICQNFLLSPSMRFLRRNRYFLIFAALMLFCGAMVLRQMAANQSAHVDLREAFILLQAKGYKTEAQRLFQRLLAELERLPNNSLAEDYQRTQMLVDPARQDPENLVWKYHWTVSNELEKRSESTLARALKLAHDR
jgi:hypothetical protein